MSETKSTTSTLKDVYFFYTSVSVPEKQLNPDGKPAESEHPLEGHSFEIKILITEDRYKKIKKGSSRLRGNSNYRTRLWHQRPPTVPSCEERLRPLPVS